MKTKQKIEIFLRFPELQNDKVRTTLLQQIVDEAIRGQSIDPTHPALIIASAPPAKRDDLSKNLIKKLEKLSLDGKIRAPKSPTRSIEKAIQKAVSSREQSLEEARVALGLLDPDETVAAKARRTREVEELKRDKKTFSSTFGKSNQRMIVQGGSPGLKR